jgi:hypothetical protein
VHQELDAHSLPSIRSHVHILLYPGIVVGTLMEDRLQDVAVAIRDISVLPVERNCVGRAGPIPETQCAATSRHCELLIERAVSECLNPRGTTKAIRCVACEC